MKYVANNCRQKYSNANTQFDDFRSASGPESLRDRKNEIRRYLGGEVTRNVPRAIARQRWKAEDVRLRARNDDARPIRADRCQSDGAWRSVFSDVTSFPEAAPGIGWRDR